MDPSLGRSLPGAAARALGRGARLASLALLGSLVLLACCSAPASAKLYHEQIAVTTEIPAEGPHKEPVASHGRLNVKGLVYASGHVWTSEDWEGTVRLDEFNGRTGSFESQILAPSSSIISGNGLAVRNPSPEIDETEIYQSVEVVLPKGEIQYTVAVYNESGFQTLWNPEATGGITGVVVDNSTALGDWASGDLYASTGSMIERLKPEAGGKEKYEGQLTLPAGVSAGPLAVDEANGDVVVATEGAIYIYEPSLVVGEYTLVQKIAGTAQAPLDDVQSLAVDGGTGVGAGDLYIAENGQSVELGPEGRYLGQLPPEYAYPAVDSETHDLYAVLYSAYLYILGPTSITPDVTTNAPSRVKVHEATLNGTVNPLDEGPATCQFVWGTSGAFGEEPAKCEKPLEGDALEPVSVTVSKLSPDTTYYFRLEASNTNGLNEGEASQNQSFTTLGPGIESWSTNVASTSATMGALIDPNRAPTSYYFQYGTTERYGSEAPGAPLGSGKGAVEVSRHVDGLEPGTVYHYRVVAVSEVEGEDQTFDGPDQTFVTQTPTAFSLPDDRQWELVSPPDKHGALLWWPGEQTMVRAAADGDAISYPASAPTEQLPAGYTNDVQVLSTRGPDGWQSRDLATPNPRATGTAVNTNTEYEFFSEDLSSAVLHPWATFEPSLTDEASEQTPYIRSDFLNGNVDEPCLPGSMHCYRPLVSGCPKAGEPCPAPVEEHADVPAGTAFGGEVDGHCPDVWFCGPQFEGATPDMSHIVISSSVPLTPEGEGGLYEWTAGKLTYVGGGTLGKPGGYGGGTSTRAISEDGSRVIAEGTMFDLPKKEALPLGGQFLTATKDASKVLVTSGGDLSECEVVEEEGKLKCKTVDLTAGTKSPELLAVLGASENFDYVYFDANGVLAPGAVPGACGEFFGVRKTASQSCNLYVYHDGVVKLVAVLSADDRGDFKGSELYSLTGSVSPNGQWLAFMSQRDLTGYDTRDAASGQPDQEVYLYDAEGDGGEGKLVCASCDPTGALPVGVETGAVQPLRLNGTSRIWEPEQWIAASIPGWMGYSTNRGNSTLYQPRYLSDSGRLFFNSSDALVPQDVNGQGDVYEYEPPGIGDCTTSNATFSPRSEGCVNLISSGADVEESAFQEAGEGGRDVFFQTKAKLVPEDFDEAMDVYDARECTGAADCYPPPVSQPPACDSGDSCKPSPSPQPLLFGAPASQTFVGAGNPSSVQPSTKGGTTKPLTRAQKLARALKTCRKQRKRVRAACERKARARYASRRHGKSKRGRR